MQAAEQYISESTYFKGEIMLIRFKQKMNKTCLETAIMIGHVGDGNFHIFTGVDPTVPEEVADIRRLSDKVAAKSLELGGTCTGEHGIGLGESI